MSLIGAHAHARAHESRWQKTRRSGKINSEKSRFPRISFGLWSNRLKGGLASYIFLAQFFAIGKIRHAAPRSILTTQKYRRRILGMSEINVTKFVVTYRDSVDPYRSDARGTFATRREADDFWAHLEYEAEDFEPIKMERVALIKEA